MTTMGTCDIIGHNGGGEMTWEDIKNKGSAHYKTGRVEPIDLIKDGGMLQAFAVASIIKYAFRNREGQISKKDMEKIKHYADMLLYLAEEE